MLSMPIKEAFAPEYKVAVPISTKYLADSPHVVVLSPSLAMLWSSKHSEDVKIVFNGDLMTSVTDIRMVAGADAGFTWSVSLVQTPTHEPPADFVSELVKCGFDVHIKDIRVADAGNPQDRSL